MSEVGAGGVTINSWEKSKRFHKEYDGLEVQLKNLVDQKLQDLNRKPRPTSLRFEKLKGYSNPDLYSIHVNGNYKISFEINGSDAFLRRVGTHNEIDRLP